MDTPSLITQTNNLQINNYTNTPQSVQLKPEPPQMVPPPLALPAAEIAESLTTRQEVDTAEHKPKKQTRRMSEFTAPATTNEQRLSIIGQVVLSNI